MQTDPAAVQGALSVEPRVCAAWRRGRRQPAPRTVPADAAGSAEDDRRAENGDRTEQERIQSDDDTRHSRRLLALALAQGGPSGNGGFRDVTREAGSHLRPSRRPRKEVHRRIDERRRGAVRLRQRRPARHLLRRFADRGDRRRSEAGAQRALPEPWRLQVQRRHRQSRRRPSWLGHGRLHRRRRRRRVGGPLRDRARRQQALSQQSRRNVQRRHGARRRRRRRLVGGLRFRRLRSRWRPRSLRQPLREGRSEAAAAVRTRQDLPVPRRSGAVRAARTAGRIRFSLQKRRQPALRRGRRSRPASPIASGAFGLGVGWFDYNEDGWPDLFVAQRFRSELPLSATRRTARSRTSAFRWAWR